MSKQFAVLHPGVKAMVDDNGTLTEIVFEGETFCNATWEGEFLYTVIGTSSYIYENKAPLTLQLKEDTRVYCIDDAQPKGIRTIKDYLEYVKK